MAQIVTIDGIPVYRALVQSDGDTGMLRISLVDDPAVQVDFLAFKNQEARKVLTYAVQDEDKHLVLGVVMRADYPIYRRDADGFEYYIIYKPDTIRTMAEKYLAENRQNLVNLMHEDGTEQEGIQMVQYFIVDREKGVAPAAFDVADGSLLAEFHVTNDDVWAAIKDGTYKGFSLEGIFDLAPEKDAADVQRIVDSVAGQFRTILKNHNHMAKLKGILGRIARAIVALGNISTDKGVLSWDGEDDLKAGDSVFVEDAEGNRTAAADGDYVTEDGKTIVVVDGKVAEIKDAAAEVAPQNEPEESAKMVQTDKGKLEWDNEDEDLKAGDAVYITDEDGNRNPAPDGDYTTEDGKIIKVADGKVTEIVDPSAEVEESEEVKARKEAYLARKQKYEESYNTKMNAIVQAVAATMGEDKPFFLCDAGDDFVVVEEYDEEYNFVGYFRYSVSWKEDGSASVADREEVKMMFVPMDFVSPWESNAPTEEDFNAVKTELEQVKAELAAAKAAPAAKPAHEEFTGAGEEIHTGNKGIDRLAKIARAGK